MKTRPAIFLMIFIFGLRGDFLCAQMKGPDVGPRYRLVQVVEPSTLQDKINEAAHEGYRLAGVASASAGTTVAVLQKAVDSEAAYSYVLLGGKGDAALQQSLNDSGAKGFRLVSRDIALDWRAPVPMQLRTVLAWMEKEPGPGKKFGYVVIPFGVKMSMKATLNPKLWADLNPLDYVRPEVTREQELGFHLVRIVSGVALIMERRDSSEGGTPARSIAAHGTKDPPAFHSLTSLKGSKLQRKLQEQAAGGYCVVDIDPEAPPIWPSILLDLTRTTSTGGAPNVCTYEVIQKGDLTEDDLSQEGARGFRLVPQSLNLYGVLQSDPRWRPEVNAIFEKVPTANEVYHYRNISAPQLADLSDKLEQTGADGYSVVKVDSTKDGELLVIMQKSERPTSK